MIARPNELCSGRSPRRHFRFRADRRVPLGLAAEPLLPEDATRPLRLARYAIRPLEPLEEDLLFVLAAIVYSDRSLRRQLRDGWQRELKLTIPVFAIDHWRSDPVRSCLHCLLEYATGDVWDLSFVERPGLLSPFQPLPLRPPTDMPAPIVVPFSGGIDSWALVAGSTHEERRSMQLVRVGREARRAQKVAEELGLRPFFGFLGVRAPHDREATYRTRSLGFFVYCALVARLIGAREIRIGENGQGTLGPSLVPTGHEHPYVGTHPGLSRRITDLMMALFGEAVGFVHPHIWETKAEMVSRVLQASTPQDREGLSLTNSCSSNVRKDKQVSIDHCGICGNCLLRRIAGVPETKYLFARLAAGKFEEMVPIDNVRVTTRDRRTMIASVQMFEAFAQLETGPGAQDRLRGAARRLSDDGYGTLAANHANLTRLIRQSAREWNEFLAELPPNAFIRQLVGRTP